jgi:hypothetical protein
MKTQINCTSRLQVLNTISKLEKYRIDYVENENGILADIAPATAWSISLI